MGTVEHARRSPVTEGSPTRLPWALALLSIALLIANVVLYFGYSGSGFDVVGVLLLLGFATTSIVGAVVASRTRGNVVGWLLVASGLSGSLAFAADTWAKAIPPLPGPGWAALLAEVGFLGWLGSVAVVLLRFPDGRHATGRWRWVEPFVLFSIALLAVSQGLSPTFSDFPGIENPIGIEALRNAAFFEGGFTWVPFLAAMLVSALSPILRHRRSAGVEREQLKWLALAATVFGIGFLVQSFSFDESLDELVRSILQIPFLIGFLFFPIAIGVAILRYRLFDIDLVIGKALVVGALAAFITLMYVVLVVVAGSLLGRGDRGNVFLAVVATAVVAVAFQPVRTRMQRVANRLVYGERATPYEVLSELVERMSGTFAIEDLLPRTARALAEGTGANRADVWLRREGMLRVEASWPADAPELEPLLVGSPGPTDATRFVEVRHHDEQLGALSVEKKPGDPLTPTEERLLGDLAAQAGLVLRNVRLIEELRSSRQRLVAAQDEERRKIERNLHDGAQQQLVALVVQLRLLETLAGTDAEKERELAAKLGSQANAALEDLRDLARGIYPPLLADQGLAAALEAQARKAAVPTTVESDRIGRFPREV
jgi:signal transduction histidine kinase